MIEFKNVSKHFGPTKVLHDIDLKINQGEVVVIIGPSGSGKSTLLRCINKLEEITSGELIVVALSLKASTSVNDALVVDLLPAGLELENQNLAEAARLPAASGEVRRLLARHGEHTLAHEGFMADRYVTQLALQPNQQVELAYLARAVTPGTYRVPPPLVESMYRPSLQGRGATPAELTVSARK